MKDRSRYTGEDYLREIADVEQGGAIFVLIVSGLLLGAIITQIALIWPWP